MNRKVIFLDVDGTLVGFDGQLPESAARALAKAHENGHELVLCTGRNVPQVYSFLYDNPDITGMITSNGSCILKNREIISNVAVDRNHIMNLIDYLHSKGSTFYLQSAEGTFGDAYSCQADRRLATINATNEEDFLLLYGVVTEVDDLCALEGINKILAYKIPATLEEVQDSLGDYFKVDGSSFNISAGGDLIDCEITIDGYQKDYGIRTYLDYIGADLEDSIAFGDGPNDFGMMSCVHTSVAMGNAVEEVKKVADMVTTNVDDDGIYNGFLELGIINE